MLANFVRSWLSAAGVDVGRDVQFHVGTKGRGCGSQFVRDNYPEEVRRLRARSHDQNVGLLAAVDADNLTVVKRAADLAAALRDAGHPRRAAAEPIAHVIPKPNIDGWMAFLTGGTGDEIVPGHDYKRATEADPDPAKRCREAGRAMPRCCKGESVSPHPVPASVGVACRESRRAL
jgi:hypothetical protein